MRKVVKCRLLFLTIAALCYFAGFQLLSPSIDAEFGLQAIIIASIVYFIFIPLCYWRLVIKAGKQKAWKLILVFSLSSLMARYSFPNNIAEYFEFITWLRYPIIAILLLIELYLVFSIIGALWKARSAKGDPRIGILEQYKDEKEAKRIIALTMAYEPASWYYALPRLSRNHIKRINSLNLLSANRWHWFGIILLLAALSTCSYLLLVDWSKTTAIVLSSIIFYGVIFMTANYRISRRHSIYIQDNKLILNNSFLGIMISELSELQAIELGHFGKNKYKEILRFGRKDSANVKLTYHIEQTYYGSMGQLPEQHKTILLSVKNNKNLYQALQQYVTIEASAA